MNYKDYIEDVLQEAAQIALGYYGKVSLGYDRPDSGGVPVSLSRDMLASSTTGFSVLERVVDVIWATLLYNPRNGYSR